MLKSMKPTTMKFLCSYGGKILPRYPDGKLRYLGGETRVLAVDRLISFSGWWRLKKSKMRGLKMMLPRTRKLSRGQVHPMTRGAFGRIGDFPSQMMSRHKQYYASSEKPAVSSYQF
ncbi:hypothetical protein HS088_TW06G00731 [Tripterygium wilfordii]|uniref:Uncharacterized protein n=1 Tax=Tripterygium wilfordii TaxID=458696 RepID=A0A7J7DJK9_TRIWF|nr:hypothetical protein HS088_TW06G00731 [Tripterygium wilfordii]